MTTLVAINTRDAVVIGADSLGTMVRSWIDPKDLSEYFDLTNGSKIRLAPDGRPALADLSQITGHCKEVVCSHLDDVDKLFTLNPLEMGVMCAGIAYIGNRSLKSLIYEFKAKDRAFKSKASNYTLKSIAERLLSFLWGHYAAQYPEGHGPELELMLCGYDKQRYTPGVARIYVHENRVQEPDYDLCLYLGGQTREIQRLLFGTDVDNKIRLISRAEDLLSRYHTALTEQLAKQGVNVTLKKPEEFGNEFKLFNNWDIQRMQANWSAFSEQSAIECVDFLVNVMIRSQKFSTDMQSVGGKVQIAIIKKDSGFTFVTKRQWRHGENLVPAMD